MASVSNVFVDEGAASALKKMLHFYQGSFSYDNSFKIGDGLSIVANKKIVAKASPKLTVIHLMRAVY